MNNGVGDLVSITFQCQFNVQSFPCMDDLFYTILELYTLHVCFLKELVQAICTCTVRKKNPIVYYIYIVWKVTDLLIHKYVALNCSIKIGTICTMISAYRNDTRAYCHSNSCSHCSKINGASILFWKKYISYMTVRETNSWLSSIYPPSLFLPCISKSLIQTCGPTCC